MIIDCPNCNKKFEIDEKLIPFEGRMLQCGSCDYKWFYKKEKFKKETNIDKIETFEKPIFDETKKIDDQHDQKEINSKKKFKTKDNNINYFKLFLVTIISLIALIIVLDTFKESLEVIFPNIQIILDNLYQSIKDIKLFVLDFIK